MIVTQCRRIGSPVSTNHKSDSHQICYTRLLIASDVSISLSAIDIFARVPRLCFHQSLVRNGQKTTEDKKKNSKTFEMKVSIWQWWLHRTWNGCRPGDNGIPNKLNLRKSQSFKGQSGLSHVLRTTVRLSLRQLGAEIVDRRETVKVSKQIITAYGLINCTCLFELCICFTRNCRNWQDFIWLSKVSG